MADVKLTITAEDTGLGAELDKAKASVQSAVSSMKSSLESLSGAFERIKTGMLAVTAVLAGGKAFSEAVSSTVNAAIGARDLGNQLGITASQASVLKVALGETGVSQEAVSGAAARITRTLSTNEGAFKALGVATRDSNGNFRNTFDIMEDVNTKLAEFKSGTDRNVEATKIYGRGWQEVAPALRLTAEAMQEAQVKAASLGLIVGDRGVEQAQTYKATMAGVGDVFEGVWKVIGESLMPALTAMGQWFNSIGPTAIALTKKAVIEVVYAFEQIKVVLQDAYELAGLVIEEMTALFTTLASVVDRALHFDFAGAKSAWKQGWAEMEGIANQQMDAIKQHAQDAMAQIHMVENQQTNETPQATQPGQRDTDDPSGKSQLSQLETELEQKKAIWQEGQAAEGQFREYSKTQEIAYWQNILATVKLGATDKLAIERKIAQDTLAAQKQGFEAQLADLKAQEAEHKNNLAARLAIEEQYAAEVKAGYGEDSKEYAQAQAAIIATKRQAVEQQMRIDTIRSEASRNVALAELAGEEQVAKQKLAAHQLSAQQYVAVEQQLETKSYEIKMQGLKAQEALATTADDPQKLAEIHVQEETLEAQHQAKMIEIKQQGQIKSDQLWNAAFANFQTGMNSNIAKALQGTETIGQAFKNMGLTMGQSVVQALANLSAKFIENAAIAVALNKRSVFSSASAAAAAAAKSAAEVPYIGWLLAPAAAAATYAAAVAFPSAEGGYDIPSNLNPVTQLHSNEMVLPSHLADAVRGMAANGGGASGGGDTHVHLSTMDVGSFKGFLRNSGNRNEVAKAMRKAHTQFSKHLRP